MYKAEVLKKSITPKGDILTTMKVVFPRIVLAEFNTHRSFSRNSASSRAIPYEKMRDSVLENPFIPLVWQAHHKGMQGDKYITNSNIIKQKRGYWIASLNNVVTGTNRLYENHYHRSRWIHNNKRYLPDTGVTKQLCNRLLEPYMWHTVIVTTSEEGLMHFFKLRCPMFEAPDGSCYESRRDYLMAYNAMLELGDRSYDKSPPEHLLEWMAINKSQADVHIQFLAEAMWDAFHEDHGEQLEEGQYHIPFSERMEGLTLEDQIKVSVARCARISYETLGDDPKIDFDADMRLYNTLKESEHWSPFEHVARVMTDDEYGESGWCRNFKGFIQHRAEIDEQ